MPNKRRGSLRRREDGLDLWRREQAATFFLCILFIGFGDFFSAYDICTIGFDFRKSMNLHATFTCKRKVEPIRTRRRKVLIWTALVHTLSALFVCRSLIICTPLSAMLKREIQRWNSHLYSIQNNDGYPQKTAEGNVPAPRFALHDERADCAVQRSMTNQSTSTIVHRHL